MKHLFLLTFAASFAFQTILFGQPAAAGSNRNAPQVIDNVQEKSTEQTLSILKPDTIKNRHIGDVISVFEDNGLHIAAIKMVRLNKDQATKFYKIHGSKPFFNELVEFMTSGPIVVMVVEGNRAVDKNRQLMGLTDPKKAEPGTIREEFGESVLKNAVHGSDSPETAREEIQFFFQPSEIYSEK